jgi:hypothetical protein
MTDTTEFASPGQFVDRKTGEILVAPAEAKPDDRMPGLLRRHGGDGRPYVQPADGSKALWYSRVTTLAKSLEKSEALTNWKIRQVAKGLASRRDLLQLVQADPDDDKKILEIAQQAMEAARAGVAANTGTAIHRMTEFVDRGQWPVGIDEDTETMLHAYVDAMERYRARHIAAEIFVANDELRVAGTFDRISIFPSLGDKPVVADLKTGRWDALYPHYVAIQLACYSRGQVYIPTGESTGNRGLDMRQVVNQDKAVMIHIPQTGPEALRCRLYEIDIAAGWRWAVTAAGVREWLRSTPIKPLET